MPNAPEKREPDWTAAECALREIDNGIAALTALADSCVRDVPPDPENLHRALYFMVDGLTRNLALAHAALAFRAGGSPPSNA